MTVPGQSLQLFYYDDNPSDLIYGGYSRRRYRSCHPNPDYCYKPHCHRSACRQLYRWGKKKQIELGIALAKRRGLLLRLVTFTLLDAQEETYHDDAINGLKRNVQSVHKKLYARLNDRGHKSMWWRVVGMKQNDPYQLHYHQLFTCTPDSDPLAHADLLQDIQKAARQHGLRAYLTAVTTPKGIAGYLAQKNLKEVDAIELPSHFRRFQASSNAPKMAWQICKAIRAKLKAMHKTFRETFPPILYYEYWHVWAVKVMRYLVIRAKLNRPPQPFQPRMTTCIPLGKWFIRRLRNLWRKVRYELQWLSHSQEHEID